MAINPRATLKDVAALAGVSRTTASNALDGSGRVSLATRDRVQKAAQHLGYSANVTASRLRTKALTNIGLYIPRSLAEVSFHMHFTLGAASGARAFGVDLTVLAYDGAASLNRIPAVDGFIIVESMKDDPVVERLLDFGMPSLLVGKYLGVNTRGSVIAIDHAAMMTHALDYLESLGVQRPGLLGPEQGFGSDWSESVVTAFRSWCKRRGITPAHRPAPALPNAEAIDKGVRELLLDEHVDALIGAHEGSAALAISALQRLGITPGPDFPLVSGVGSASDQHTLPPLTAIEMHPFEFGVAAAERLIEIIQNPTVAQQHRTHEASLVIRESTEISARVSAVSH